MIRLKDTAHPHTASFLNAAVRVAEYYGFSPLDSLSRSNLNAHPGKGTAQERDAKLNFARRDERVLLSGVRKCASCVPVRLSPEQVPIREPLLAWRITGGTQQMPSINLELHIIGSSLSVAEALLLIVAHTIAKEAGIARTVLTINNIGSADSSARYTRDVGTYLRKHLESISPLLRPRVAEDPLGALVQLIERGHPAISRAPQAMEYLTEDERRRFWELLEYLETFGLGYELSGYVLGSRDVWSHSLFELSAIDEETGTRIAFAFGGRNDPLATHVAGRHTPAAMITISCEKRGGTRFKSEARGIPGIYYAHLGGEARRRSLPLLEQLRQAGIPVHHGLYHERIGEQMNAARNLAVPFIIIMGHKEAVEGTVLVREVASNSQEAVPALELPSYLKRRRLAPLASR